ncbi:MAG: hypothetical protein LC777_10805 [Actinobacteria bacterium]|nr:hypothetical protein [Actinomycetota bacterium]
MRALTVVVATLLLCFGPATIATAQLGPNAPSPLTRPDPPPAPEAPKTDEGGLSTLQRILIFGSAAAILVLIGWFIVRDAHKAAPVQEHAPRTPDEKRMSARERERRQRQRRARDKAARRQRKKNRQR